MAFAIFIVDTAMNVIVGHGVVIVGVTVLGTNVICVELANPNVITDGQKFRLTGSKTFRKEYSCVTPPATVIDARVVSHL